MANQIENFRKIAKKNPKKIALPEGNEPRVLEAVSEITARRLAEIILIGNENDIRKKAKGNPVSLDEVEVIDPAGYARSEEMVNMFYDSRKHKGITREDAEKAVLGDPVYFGAMLVRLGIADGFVAGASHTTSDVARASLYCIGLDAEIGVMSSSFVMELENCPYGDRGLFIFADCGIVPNPDAGRLAGIALSSSRLYEDLFKKKPLVALLSYSTKGSAKGESVNKVTEALKIIKAKRPDLAVDGELQLDAAIIPEVAEIKAPASPIAGKANVLIFPNLDSGNIAYKLIQRLGNARVVGPLLQGVKHPASDLSRGCGVEEIIDAVVITAIRAQQC